MSSDYLQNAAKTMENISWKKVGIAAAVGGTAVVGAPMVVSALGFQAGGIAAGSLAAKAMSSAAIANGGGIAAGSTISVLQSVGVLGFYTKTSVLIAGAAGSGTAPVTGITKERNSEEVGGELGNKSIIDGASSKAVVDVASSIMASATSNTISALQSVGLPGLYTKTSVIIAEAAGSGTALVTDVTKERNSQEVGGEVGGKSVVDGARSKAVVDGASGIMASATSILGDVVKRSSSLWPGTTATGSDTKKAD